MTITVIMTMTIKISSYHFSIRLNISMSYLAKISPSGATFYLTQDLLSVCVLSHNVSRHFRH